MPERKSQKLVADQDLGKTSFNLVYRGLLVKLGNSSQRVGGDKPDPRPVGIDHADKNEVGINVARVQIADSLPVEGHAFLRRPFGLVTDSAQVAGERAIDDYFQLGSKVLALNLPSRGGQLQVLGSDRIIS